MRIDQIDRYKVLGKIRQTTPLDYSASLKSDKNL